MNCPHHTQIYASRSRSYKDLPIRYMETTVQYRDEKAGELLGLSRVRAITIDDSHVFCRPDQVEEEFRRIMDMIQKMYSTLEMEFKARLSFRDSSDKFLGDPKHWEEAQKTIEDVAEKLGLNYTVAEGEAAFYGPKIDIMVLDSLGREWQCATQQLDFVQPERFGLKYIDADGSEKTPFMIHKALLGSIERFLSVYIEHTGGAFPTWIAPIQVKIIPIADRHNPYAQKLLEQIMDADIRVEVDDRSETMQSKIRDAQLEKIPYMLIVGDREEKEEQVSIRKRSGENINGKAFFTFLEEIKKEIADRA
jgi:threonyl-tRNA synthetase